MLLAVAEALGRAPSHSTAAEASLTRMAVASFVALRLVALGCVAAACCALQHA